MVLRAVATGVRDAVGPRELVAEVVRRGRLQGLSVAIIASVVTSPRAGEPLTCALAPGSTGIASTAPHVGVHPCRIVSASAIASAAVSWAV